jgi:hypothetical protein
VFWGGLLGGGGAGCKKRRWFCCGNSSVSRDGGLAVRRHAFLAALVVSLPARCRATDVGRALGRLPASELETAGPGSLAMAAKSLDTGRRCT